MIDVQVADLAHLSVHSKNVADLTGIIYSKADLDRLICYRFG